MKKVVVSFLGFRLLIAERVRLYRTISTLQTQAGSKSRTLLLMYTELMRVFGSLQF